MNNAYMFPSFQELVVLLLCCLQVTLTQSIQTLKIGAPWKLGFREFVSVQSKSNGGLEFNGFAISVFNKCVEGINNEKLQYKVDFHAIGDGTNDPIYDDMVQSIVNGTYHGVVADLTITAQRIEKVDFTQPYIQSTLVMVVPLYQPGKQTNLWNFLKPFNFHLWIAIFGSFIATVCVLQCVENKNFHHDDHFFHNQSTIPDTPTSMYTRMCNVLWFTSMTIFFVHRNNVSTTLGRFIVVAWLLFLLIVINSYTASLSSILLAQESEPIISSLQELKDSKFKIGYQDGTFVHDYLKNNLGLDPHRLVPLANEDDYDTKMEKYLQGNTKDGVAAILDEYPYIQTFLATRSCHFTVVDSEIAYFGGFAFAFSQNSNLTSMISKQLIKLEETGDLHNLNLEMLSNATSSKNCADLNTKNQITLSSIGGLFIIIAIVYIVVFFLRAISWYFKRYSNNNTTIEHGIELQHSFRQFHRRSSMAYRHLDLDPYI